MNFNRLSCDGVTLGVDRKQNKIFVEKVFAFSFPAPTAPPDKIFAEATSPTSLFVTWGSVSKEHRHGDINVHKVYVSPADMQNHSRTVPVSGSSLTYIGDLMVYTLYVISVSAVNDVGEGPKSKAFTARTMASGRLMELF